ncbi:hypothetical protein BCR42DRAFT_419349 [Absidia repens]|uniref:Uncharacterized protein n=1 Tax=Absidia repens TaxID=90262 RepID=A0A1X2ICK7_9FUNG|nr:hypothetical protein BCR42DRAFT_419349 [Absidia repens]
MDNNRSTNTSHMYIYSYKKDALLLATTVDVILCFIPNLNIELAGLDYHRSYNSTCHGL